MAGVGSGADLRYGGVWTASQRMKNDAIWALARAALGAARFMPLGLLVAVGRLLGSLAHAGARGQRRQALANVALALPHLDASARRALVRQCFHSLGEVLGETVALLGGEGALEPLVLAPEARRTLEDARAEGRGVIFASAHLGPWERVAAAIAASGLPFTAVTRDSYDPRFSRLQNEMRRSAGVNVIRRARAQSSSATLGIFRALRRGEVVGMVMDLRSRVPSCEVPFLGIPAQTALGPARIALRTGSPVVVGSAAPAGACKAQVSVTATRIPVDGLDGPGGAIELTARINAELSRRILAMPHAWVWMHERWPGPKHAMMAVRHG